jgi:hypothetical protein
MAEASERLYRVEYAKSGRASCKKCSESIPKDSLRMAIMVQVRRGREAGWAPGWLWGPSRRRVPARPARPTLPGHCADPAGKARERGLAAGGASALWAQPPPSAPGLGVEWGRGWGVLQTY